MELVAALVLLFVVWFWFRFRRGTSRNSQKKNAVGSQQSFKEDRRKLAKEGIEPGVWKPKGGIRPKGRTWRIWEESVGYEIAGITFRKNDVIDFLVAVRSAEAKGSGFLLALEREPENPHDRNAIKVYGVCGDLTVQIGYIEADLAKQVATELPEGVPISAVLSRVFVGDEGYIELKANILVPGKNDAYWDGKENPF